MKKLAALFVAVLMLLCSVSALADVQIGQVEYAAHGTKCFAVLTAVVDGDTIVAAHINEFQVMSGDDVVGVPNTETMFADEYAEGKVLASKRTNNGSYSTNMYTKAGSTQPLGVSYEAIEAYVTGKTIAELEEIVAGNTSETMVDAVSGSTLQDTLGYVSGLLEAAKAASLATGYYTLYNQTGETVTEVTMTDNTTGEVKTVAANLEAGAVKVVTFSGAADTSITLKFTTEGGYTAAFESLHIETAPLTLLAADALTGATVISFSAPAAN